VTVTKPMPSQRAIRLAGGLAMDLLPADSVPLVAEGFGVAGRRRTRLDLGIAGMERVLADDAARFGSAAGSVRWLKYALFHLALPAGGGWAGEPDRSWENHGAAAEVPG